METASMDSSVQKSGKAKAAKSPGLVKRLDPAAAKLLAQLKERANKKPFGRKVQEREILNLSLKLVNEDHIKEIQLETYSEQDRLKMAHEEHQKLHGKLTLNQFIGKLLSGEVSNRK